MRKSQHPQSGSNIRSLDDAANAGEPLIDIEVLLKDGVDYSLATEIANSLGPDCHLDKCDWYGNPKRRTGQVTSEGALRLFGVKVRRVQLDRRNEQLQRHDGKHESLYRWDSVPIRQWPEPLVPYFQSIAITQPGADDECQPYIPLFDR